MTDRQSQRFADSLSHVRSDLHAVHDGIHVMHSAWVDFRELVKVVDLTIQTDAYETGLADSRQYVVVLSSTPADQGRQEHGFRTVRQFQ